LLRERASKTVQEVFDAYRADRDKDGKQVHNFDWHWKALRSRFASMDVDDITADVCRDYAKTRMDAGKSPGTVWTELTLLRSCINWALKRNVIPRSPYVWVCAKPEPKQLVMSEAQVIALLDACTFPHTRLFVILAMTTGARSTAICELKWSAIDFEAGSIDLRRHEPDNPLMKKVRKGRSVVPMSDEARAALSEAQKGALSEYVIEWDGEPIKKIRKSFMKAVADAKLKGVTPHTLRHTCLTWLDEGDIPMARIAKFAGHRDERTTSRIYAKPRVETLRPAAEVIDMRLRRDKSQKK
jgi:integrase